MSDKKYRDKELVREEDRPEIIEEIWKDLRELRTLMDCSSRIDPSVANITALDLKSMEKDGIYSTPC